MTNVRIDRMQCDVQVNQPGKLMAITLIAGLAVMFLAITGLTSPELTAGQNDLSAASSPATNFVYFPGQYSNQATEPGEHIQAF